MIREINFKLKGMRQDVDESMPNVEYAYLIKNMRFSDSDNSNRSVLCSEQGSKECIITGDTTVIPEFIYGYCVVNNTLVLLGKLSNADKTEVTDAIVQYELTGEFEFKSTIIFEGDLNIPADANVQTVGIDEGNGTRKVYWVDGYNQIRLVNLNNTYKNSEYLNIVPPLDEESTLTYKLHRDSSGNFKAGVIQYGATYSMKNGQETSLLPLTDIITIADTDKGNEPNTYVGNSIEVILGHPNEYYDKVNIYSIYRSTLDSTPEIKALTQIDLRDRNTSIFQINRQETFQGSINNVMVKTDEQSAYAPIHFYSSSIGGSNAQNIYTFEKVNPAFKIKTMYGEYSFTGGTDVVITIRLGFNTYNTCTITNTVRANVADPVGLGVPADFTFEENTVSYIDNGYSGETLDANYLFTMMGDTFSSKTLQHKDNVLFTGNIETKNISISSIKVGDKSLTQAVQDAVTLDNRYFNHIKELGDESFYSYEVNTADAVIKDKVFKTGEHYRLGIMFQHRSGKMSEVIHLGDVKNNLAITTDEYRDKKHYIYGGFASTLSSNIIEAVRDAGYIKAIPVVCYPEISDRLVVAQGIVNPTIFIGKQRKDSEVYAQASWNMRPIPWYEEVPEESLGSYRGTAAEDSHYYSCNLRKDDINKKRGSLEFQSSSEDYNISSNTNNSTDRNEREACEVYYVDCNTVTFHTPDFELGQELDNASLHDLDFRIVGFAPICAHQARYVAEMTPYGSNEMEVRDIMLGLDGGAGDIYDNSNTGGIIASQQPRGTVSAAPGVYIEKLKADDDGEGFRSYFYLYPFQSKGPVLNIKDKTAANVKKKSLATVAYSNESKYLHNTDYLNAELGITTPSKYFVENYNSGLILNNPDKHPSTNLYYKGAVNHISLGVPYILSTTYVRGDGEVTSFKIPEIRVGEEEAPMEVSYKTNKHLVFSFNYADYHKPVVLPSSKVVTENDSRNLFPYFEKNTGNGNDFEIEMLGLSPEVMEETILNTVGPKGNYYKGLNPETLRLPHSIHLIGELYRKSVHNAFGGTSDTALLNNKFLIAGEQISLLDSEHDLQVQWTEGDTYYTRYDILKALPYSEDNMNSVTNITSVMCETRVNLDYRYDRNRGERDATALNIDNFNLLNPVYQQTNNFVSYYTEDVDTSSFTSFPTDVAWTGVKTSNTAIDAWTKFNLATSYRLDLDKGDITGLTRYNNELFAVQQKGFSRLLYNPRVQIPMSDGVPIEISNSRKMEGAVYISESIGSYSIKSICTTPNGVYFHDPRSKALYLFNNEGLRNISYMGGMSGFFDDNNSFSTKISDTDNPWCLFYDFIDNEVYINNKDFSLVFNEQNASFTSFYDYNNVPFILNVKDALFAPSGDFLHRLQEGDTHSDYLGNKGDQVLEILANDGSVESKVYNSIEFESETFEPVSVYDNSDNFTDISIRNNYQKGNGIIKATKYRPSNLKKKLCMNRLLIPRQNDSRNRIVSSNAYVSLLRKNITDKGKVTIHNIKVKYF